MFLDYQYRDGGRDAAGYRSQDDCMIRAITIHIGAGDSDGETYKSVRKTANTMARQDKRVSDFRDWKLTPDLMAHFGFEKVKLPRTGARPTYAQAHAMYGNCIVTTNGHVCALKDGYLCDTWDGREYKMQDDYGDVQTHTRKARSVYRAPQGR